MKDMNMPCVSCALLFMAERLLAGLKNRASASTSALLQIVARAPLARQLGE